MSVLGSRVSADRSCVDARSLIRVTGSVPGGDRVLSPAPLPAIMGDRVCYRESCPECETQVTVADEACPECGRALPVE
jgi:hypothetical protein